MNNYNNYNTYVKVDTDPNGHKSKRQMYQEISILEERIKRNKEMLQSVSYEEKNVIENQIDEDTMRVNALYYTIKKHQSEMIGLFVILIISLLAIFWVSYRREIFSFFGSKSNDKLFINENLVIGNLTATYYPKYVIEGIVENRANFSFSSVQIEYTTYDKNGYTLGTCSSYLSTNLASKGKQKFQVECTESPTQIVSYKLTKLTGY